MIPTEPIGSLPRPLALIETAAQGDSDDPRLDPLYAAAIRDTIERFEATGSPVITDGEQRKYHNFWTYSSTTRDTAFAKIRARVLGTRLAAERLGAE
jgi:methionine synthase II (cobalamin-independent)